MGMARLSSDIYRQVEQAYNSTISDQPSNISLKSTFNMDQSLRNVAQGLRYDGIDTNPGLNQ